MSLGERFARLSKTPRRPAPVLFFRSRLRIRSRRHGVKPVFFLFLLRLLRLLLLLLRLATRSHHLAQAFEKQAKSLPPEWHESTLAVHRGHPSLSLFPKLSARRLLLAEERTGSASRKESEETMQKLRGGGLKFDCFFLLGFFLLLSRWLRSELIGRRENRSSNPQNLL